MEGARRKRGAARTLSRRHARQGVGGGFDAVHRRQALFQRLDRLGPGEQVALHGVDAGDLEELALGLGLDPLGHHLHAERAADRDHARGPGWPTARSRRSR